ncbi:hypothetical protein C1646_678070 [Rhizophagus diaphanus]|nr:hypothetical protein C1646_678070 [Rhizophagus diaphanus] [Rhizophagus sp. MUCL 43196]
MVNFLVLETPYFILSLRRLFNSLETVSFGVLRNGWIWNIKDVFLQLVSIKSLDLEHRENISGNTTELAEMVTEIIEIETEKSKSYLSSRVWKYFEKKSIEGEDNIIFYVIFVNIIFL